MQRISLSHDNSVIIHTGNEDKKIDFNKKYQGYYPPSIFSCADYIESLGYLIAGMNDQGEAVAFQSFNGDVWKPLNLKAFTLYKGMLNVHSNIVEMYYSRLNDKLYLFCEDGHIILLPDCPVCVKIYEEVT